MHALNDILLAVITGDREWTIDIEATTQALLPFVCLCLVRPESFRRARGEEEREALAMHLREDLSHIDPMVADSRPFRKWTL